MTHLAGTQRLLCVGRGDMCCMCSVAKGVLERLTTAGGGRVAPASSSLLMPLPWASKPPPLPLLPMALLEFSFRQGAPSPPLDPFPPLRTKSRENWILGTVFCDSKKGFIRTKKCSLLFCVLYVHRTGGGGRPGPCMRHPRGGGWAGSLYATSPSPPPPPSPPPGF